jgi:hypothetical protein
MLLDSGGENAACELIKVGVESKKSGKGRKK